MFLTHNKRRVVSLMAGAFWGCLWSVHAHAQGSFPASVPAVLPQSTLGTNDPATMLAYNLKILAQNPYDVDALLNAGLGSLAAGDPNAAIGFLARAEELSPRNGRVKAALGTALTQVERPVEALRLFGDAAALGVPDYDLARDRGLAWDLRGDPKRAQSDYSAALKNGRNDEVTRRYALSLGIVGKKDEALKLLDPLVKRGDQGAWRARAFVFAMNGDMAEADRIVRAVMPPEMVPVMSPFLRRLPALSFGQRAQAVNFGTIPATNSALAVIDPGDFRSVGNGANAGLVAPAARVAVVAPIPVQESESPKDRRKREKQEKELARLAERGRRASGIAAPANATPRQPMIGTGAALPRPGGQPATVVRPPISVAAQEPRKTPVASVQPRPPVEIAKAEPSPNATRPFDGRPLDQRVGRRVGDVDPTRMPSLDTNVSVVAGATSLPLPDSVAARGPVVAVSSTPQPSPVQNAVTPPKSGLVGPPAPSISPPAVSAPIVTPPAQPLLTPTPVKLPSAAPSPMAAAPPMASPSSSSPASSVAPSPFPSVSMPTTTLPLVAAGAPSVVAATGVSAPPRVEGASASPSVPISAPSQPQIPPVQSVPSQIASVAKDPPAASVGGASPPAGLGVPSVSVSTPPSAAPSPPESASVVQSTVTLTTATSSTTLPPAVPTLAPDFKPLPGATITVLPETSVTPPAVSIITPSSTPVAVEAPAVAAPEAGLGSVIDGLAVEEQSAAGPIPTEAEFRQRQAAAKRKEEAALKLAADQKAKAKAASEAKAKEEADAKARVEREKLAAELEAKEQAAKLKAAPARVWVQIATGANKSGLPITWKKLKADAPKALDGQAVWYVPFRATNRLLVGPFKSQGEARSLVNRLGKDGISATTYVSEAGQDVNRLGGR
jgi:Flp pilus assembly protein TadD